MKPHTSSLAGIGLTPSMRRALMLRDAVFWGAMGALALLGTVVVLFVAWFLVGESLPLLEKGGLLRFFTDEGWWPTDGSFNLSPMIVTSVAITVGALLLVAPFSLAFSIFTTFRGRSVATRFLRMLTEASAAVPTVIFGLWGATVVVPLLGKLAPPGASLLAGIIVLSMMIFPTVTLLTQAALEAVPRTYAQAASALGVSESTTMLRVVLPVAGHGIFSALLLGAARAIGETMVVLMVCGNIVQMPGALLDPVRTLTANIALEMPYAMGDHRTSLFVSGLMMLFLVSAMVAVSEWMCLRGRARLKV
jgi:phosphate transport system permease protein